MQPKKFDVSEAAKEAVASSPEVTTDFDVLAVKEPLSEPLQAVDTEANHAYGRTASKLLNLAHKEALGEGLDNDFIQTFGDVFGGLFDGITKLGAPRWLPLAMVGIFSLPAVGVIGLRIFKTYQEREKKDER